MPESEKTETASIKQPATNARQTNQSIEKKNATSVCYQICVSFPAKPGAQRAQRVSLLLPPSLPNLILACHHLCIHKYTTKRQGHGKPLTPEYLFGMPLSRLRKLAKRRGVNIVGEKEQLIARLLATEGRMKILLAEL